MANAASGDSYEAEQRRLRAQAGLEEGLEEEDGEDDIDIRSGLQSPEVNPEIYKDVEPILFRGFVTTSAVINDVTFVFKSLNHHEFEWLSMTQTMDPNDVPAMQRYYSLFLSYGVALVDGINVLKARDDHLPDLVDFFSRLPRMAHQRVVRHLSDLNRRANRAVLLVEPYVMENRSRMRWVQVKGLDLSTTAITGFEGTDSLGLNWGQLTWRALNSLEDLQENAEREWENAKFVASSMAGKGMQKIYSADKRRRQDAKAERVERREKIIRLAILNEPLEESKVHQDMAVPRTVAELTDQLERDLKGEKDWHDRVIDEHENRARANLHDRSQVIHEARAAHIREFGDRPVVVGTDLTGLSPGEVQKRMRERRAKLVEDLAVQAEHPADAKSEEFSQKWLQQPVVRTLPIVMPTTSQSRPKVTPFGKRP